MHKALIMSVMSALLLGLLVLSVCASSYSNSIMWTNFKGTDKRSFLMSESYTSMTADVITHVVWNESGSAVKVGFFNETVTPQGIWLYYAREGETNAGTLDVWYLVEPNEVKIATGTWSDGNTTRVKLSGGKLTVICHYGETSKATILENFSFDKPLAYVQTTGASTYSLQGGYVQVNVNAGAGAGMDSAIMDWMPTLLSFAMLGMTVGILKKFAW